MDILVVSGANVAKFTKINEAIGFAKAHKKDGVRIYIDTVTFMLFTPRVMGYDYVELYSLWMFKDVHPSVCGWRTIKRTPTQTGL